MAKFNKIRTTLNPQNSRRGKEMQKVFAKPIAHRNWLFKRKTSTRIISATFKRQNVKSEMPIYVFVKSWKPQATT